MYKLPSTLSKRTCSFGFGERVIPMNKQGRDSPPPTTYTIKGFTQNNNTMAFNLKEFCKFGVRPNSIFGSRGNSPGPGAYDHNNFMNNSRDKGFTLKGKRKKFFFLTYYSKAFPLKEIGDTRAWNFQPSVHSSGEFKVQIHNLWNRRQR